VLLSISYLAQSLAIYMALRKAGGVHPAYRRTCLLWIRIGLVIGAMSLVCGAMVTQHSLLALLAPILSLLYSTIFLAVNVTNIRKKAAARREVLNTAVARLTEIAQRIAT